MRIRLTLMAIALLLAGCGETTDDDPGSQSGPDLDGRTFIATSIEDGGATRQLVNGTELRLTFDDGQLGINAGCNHMSGHYEVEENRMTVGGMAGTDMGCEPRLMDQDAWVSALFEEPVTVSLTGDVLTLTSGEVVLELTDREVVSPDAPLEGTTWTLDSLITDDAVSSVPGGVVATLHIEDGEALVNDGCNIIGGTAIVEGSHVTFTLDYGAVAGSRPCGDRETVDGNIATVLDGEVTWTIEEKSLTLMNGNEGLGFRAE